MKELMFSAAMSLAAAGAAPAETTAIFGAAVPLIEAVRAADSAGVASALQGGAEVAQKDALGRTALHYAAALGFESILGQLLGSGAEADLRDAQGITPLMRAAQNGHPAVVKLLLQSGADAGLEDDASRTALSFAGENAEIVALLRAATD